MMKLTMTAKKLVLTIAKGILALSVLVIIILALRNLNISQPEDAATDQKNITIASDSKANSTEKNEGINGADGQANDGKGGQPDDGTDSQPNDGIRDINVYTVDREFRSIITQYAKENWNFRYRLNIITDEIVYSSYDIINKSADLLANDPGSIDLYCVPFYAQEFVKGELAEYACTYEELGINVDEALRKADIPQYAIDNGSNPEGELIALPYVSTVSVFLYRRSVAKEVWGTDDPDAIVNIIGGATKSWENFKQAALKLKEHGYYIVPGFKDLIYSLDFSASYNNEGMNPQWEEFMELSKYLYDNGCIKTTDFWTNEWFTDLRGEGDKIFGTVTYTDYYQYLGLENATGDWAVCLPPYIAVNDYDVGTLANKNSSNLDILGPFIEWLTLDSSDNGLQYQYAKGTFDKGEKLSVISGTVLNNVDSSRELLGGQNINPIVYKALNHLDGQLSCGDLLVIAFQDAVSAYLWDGKDKRTVIEELKVIINPDTHPQ